MTDILDISDDVWFLTFHFLTPFDFSSMMLTCLHFQDITNPTKHVAINKLWKHQCQMLWTDLQTDYKEYTTSNYWSLFQSIIDFIVTTLTGGEWKSYTAISGITDHDPKSDDKLISKLRKRACNMEITVDRILNLKIRTRLSIVIAADNVAMFKICISNTNDINSSGNTNPNNSDSDENGSALGLTLSFGWRIHKSYLQPILIQVVQEGAVKIANYLLGPVVVATKSTSIDNDKKLNQNEDKNSEIKHNSDNNDNNIDDGGDGNMNCSYNFPNIDVVCCEEGSAQDTALTLAAYHKHVEIVSLLINHPNMSKKGINKGDKNSVVPLHCACTHSINNKATPEGALEIAKMLMDDERTDINAVDKDGDSAIMFALRSQPQIVPTLLANDKFDINIPKNSGDTALHIIAAMGTGYVYGGRERKQQQQKDALEFAKQLMKRKDFDPGIQNSENLTPLQVAEKEGFTEMAQLLRQAATLTDDVQFVQVSDS